MQCERAHSESQSIFFNLMLFLFLTYFLSTVNMMYKESPFSHSTTCSDCHGFNHDFWLKRFFLKFYLWPIECKNIIHIKWFQWWNWRVFFGGMSDIWMKKSWTHNMAKTEKKTTILTRSHNCMFNGIILAKKLIQFNDF